MSAALTAEDQTLTKTSLRIENSRIVDRMIVKVFGHSSEAGIWSEDPKIAENCTFLGLFPPPLWCAAQN